MLGVALALLVRISLRVGMDADAANKAPARGRLPMYAREARKDWYDPATHHATFAVAYDGRSPYPENELDRITSSPYEAVLGRPSALYRLDGRAVLVYSVNLYRQHRRPAPGSAKRE